MIPRHKPAFANQIAQIFNLSKGDRFLDLTLGDGGHTEEALLAGAKVVSLDADIDAINRSRQFINGFKSQVVGSQHPVKINSDIDWLIIHGHFDHIGDICKNFKLPKFKSVWADLGTSQYQLANPARGFSFQSDAPLDMRLDQTQTLTAKDLVNALNVGELEDLLLMGDEYLAKPIAKAIIAARSRHPITTTDQLVKIITSIKKPFGKIHPATKSFMALRMVVNLEREALSTMLTQLPDLVLPQGRIGVISFHSGEDRLVKQAFKDLVSSGKFSAINHKPIEPTQKQLKTNKKIRSAKLRLIEKND